MSTQHTKGPWKFGSSNDDSVYKRNIGGSDGYHVAVASSREDDEVDANARLIAAAPDLLEALQSIVDMDVAYQRGPKVEDAVEVARAAIAKATGETK
jgi:hypothetical protein